MANANWYAGWGWILWFGFLLVLFSSVGSLGYTYRVHRNGWGERRRTAHEILDARYASGEITHEEYVRMKSALNQTAIRDTPRKAA